MIRVWYSNHIERLADRLVASFESGDDPLRGLFEAAPIVVPNRSIEAYLKYAIARASGVCAGLLFQVPEAFLAALLAQCEPRPGLLNGRLLRSLFLDLLADEDEAARALPAPVRSYLEAAGAGADARDLRRFQLASRLAQLARRYGESRPDLLRAWTEGRAGLREGAHEATEDWQRSLWMRLAGPGGLIESARTTSGGPRLLPAEVFSFLEQAGRPEPPGVVHLFGFSYVGRGLRALLEYLDERTDVHVYALTPSVPFREDLAELEGRATTSRTARKPARKGPRTPYGGDDAGTPAIVREWGRPGQEYFQILNELPEVEFRPAFERSTGGSMLGRLQREVLVREVEEGPPAEPDGSVTILACPSIRREAEIIADEIWRLVAENDRGGGRGQDRLRFPEIAVLLADATNRPAYQAHLRAAFEELYDIPYAMVDLPLSGESRLVEAVLLLLELPLGQFTRPEVLKLLTHTAVRARFPDADADRWRVWCEALEIVHGADRDDHVGTYIDRDLFHWEQGLRRLVLGAFLTGPRSGDDRGFPLGGSEYLPHDEPVEAQADAARLLLFIRSLVADARFAREQQLSMSEWSEFLARMISAYLGAETEADQRALAQCLNAVHDLKDLDVGRHPVGYRIALESLRNALAELTGARGHYLATGVVVSSLLEMRALPFRVAFVCGLGEGRFPASDGPDPLDLSLTRRQIGDVTSRERDKYLFLETLASTRDKLYVSFVSRDAQTGETLEPSPMVHALIRHLEPSAAETPAHGLVIQHPLRRYADGYVPAPETPRGGELIFPTVSRAAKREARAKRLRRSLGEHLAQPDPRLSLEAVYQLDGKLRDWLGLCPLEEVTKAPAAVTKLSISFRDLRRFLECPLQGWAQVMLRLREDEEDTASREDEPFATARLPATGLLREVFLESLKQDGRDGDERELSAIYDERAEALTRRGLTPVGLFRDADRRRHLAGLESWRSEASRAGLLARGPFQVYRFGRAAENDPVDRLESPIVLEVPVPRRAGAPGPGAVRVELFGRTEIVADRLPGSVSTSLRDGSRDKDFLAGFLDAAVLSLANERQGRGEYQAHVLHAAGGARRTFRAIDAKRARAYLTDLLAELLGGPHAYLLPCESVFDYLRKGNSITASVEWMREDPRASCSSRYGPVPDFAQYAPLDEGEAVAAVERRFGLFRDSGGLDE